MLVALALAPGIAIGITRVRRPTRPGACTAERLTSRIIAHVFATLALFTQPAAAQEVFSGGAQPPPGDVFNGAAPPPEDLHKYLSPDGRFIDRCRYWHDHPDADTRMYGWPDHFKPGQPMGETRSFNGVPAPYGRCAIDPCAPYGTICWRNPSKPQPRNAQLQAILKAQGCEATPSGDIYCARDKYPHPGPPVTTPSGETFKSKCHVVGNGITCDPNEQFAGGDAPPGPSPSPGPGDRYAGGTPSPGPGDPFNGDPSHRLPPPPCDMPTPEQLAQVPDDGDVAIAYMLPPEGGDIAQAQMLPPEDGDIAVALALPSEVTLKGGVRQNGTFTAPAKPTVLRGKASVNGWPTAPDGSKKLQGYAVKSLRVPVTYQPAHSRPSGVSPQESTKIQLVLSGGTNLYNPEVGEQRFIAGFLQCMAARLKEKSRYGFRPPPKEPEPGESCKINPKPPRPQAVFDDAINEPDEDPAGAAKFFTDMFDEAFKHNKTLAERWPGIEKTLGVFGPLVAGASFIKPYRDTLKEIMKRDKALQKELAQVNGADPRYASRQPDPQDVGCLVGQDMADAYVYFVQTSFALGFSFDPAIQYQKK
jgi:hypothetical protein